MKLSLTVPLPPSLNNVYTNGRGHGRRVLTTEARQYKASAALLARSAAALACVSLDWSAERRLELRLRLHFADRRRTDISNRVKILEDALSELLGFDDCCVDRLVVERGALDKANPRCEVVLETLC